MNFRYEKFIKILIYLGFISLVLLFMTLWISRVDDKVGPKDVEAIQKIFGEISCKNLKQFDAQVSCIRSLQSTLSQKFPDRRCAKRFVIVEPNEFLNRGHGCCFDRARLLEKALDWMGFEVRRLALFDTTRYGLFALFIPNVSSHATLEVLTSKGWMGVDSNFEFVLIDNDNNPLIYKQIKKNQSTLLHKVRPIEFYEQDLVGVYGLYSRHGFSHSPMLPGPEINWKQFFQYNF